MTQDVSIQWANQEMRLLPERALFIVDSQTLVIADPHFGKAATFRAGGIPVPSGTTAATLQRLDACMLRFEVLSLVVLGDFFHAKPGRSDAMLEALLAWRNTHAAVDVTVVRGNHDSHAGDPPSALQVRCVDGPCLRHGVDLEHGHEQGATAETESLARPTLSGHIHPQVILRDRDHTRLRCPCFAVTANRIVLPAFGAFTGGHSIRSREWDRVFAIGPDRVIEVPAGPRRAGSVGNRG